ALAAEAKAFGVDQLVAGDDADGKAGDIEALHGGSAPKRASPPLGARGAPEVVRQNSPTTISRLPSRCWRTPTSASPKSHTVSVSLRRRSIGTSPLREPRIPLEFETTFYHQTVNQPALVPMAQVDSKAVARLRRPRRRPMPWTCRPSHRNLDILL